MNRLLGFVGMTIGGWFGWQVGAFVGVFTAFILAMVGTGVGLYAARRFASTHLP